MFDVTCVRLLCIDVAAVNMVAFDAEYYYDQYNNQATNQATVNAARSLTLARDKEFRLEDQPDSILNIRLPEHVQGAFSLSFWTDKMDFTPLEYGDSKVLPTDQYRKAEQAFIASKMLSRNTENHRIYMAQQRQDNAQLGTEERLRQVQETIYLQQRQTDLQRIKINLQQRQLQSRKDALRQLLVNMPAATTTDEVISSSPEVVPSAPELETEGSHDPIQERRQNDVDQAADEVIYSSPAVVPSAPEQEASHDPIQERRQNDIDHATDESATVASSRLPEDDNQRVDANEQITENTNTDIHQSSDSRSHRSRSQSPSRSSDRGDRKRRATRSLSPIREGKEDDDDQRLHRNIITAEVAEQQQEERRQQKTKKQREVVLN